MAAPKHQAPQGLAGESRTLGDLLYAGPRTPPLESDWVALVRAAQCGDERALHALYDRTHRLVFTLVVRITSNRETAEEVTLDVFHGVWRRAADYDPANGTVLGWIMNQARSRAIDRLRLEQRKKRTNPGAEDPLPSADVVEPSATAEFREVQAALQKALRLLSVDERQAIETAYFGEMTHAEAAARLNAPLGTVKTRIRSAVAKLRKTLGDIDR